jgi:hypothetical protein
MVKWFPSVSTAPNSPKKPFLQLARICCCTNSCYRPCWERTQSCVLVRAKVLQWEPSVGLQDNSWSMKWGCESAQRWEWGVRGALHRRSGNGVKRKQTSSGRIPNSVGHTSLSLAGFFCWISPKLSSSAQPSRPPGLWSRFEIPVPQDSKNCVQCIHDTGIVVNSDLLLIFMCSFSIDSRTRTVRSSTSSLMNFEVSTGGRAAKSH